MEGLTGADPEGAEPRVLQGGRPISGIQGKSPAEGFRAKI